MARRASGAASPRQGKSARHNNARYRKALSVLGGMTLAAMVAGVWTAPSLASDPPKGCSRSHQRKANRWGSVLIAPSPAPSASPTPAPPAQLLPQPQVPGPVPQVAPGKSVKPLRHSRRRHRRTSLREDAPGNAPQAAGPRPFYGSC